MADDSRGISLQQSGAQSGRTNGGVFSQAELRVINLKDLNKPTQPPQKKVSITGQLMVEDNRPHSPVPEPSSPLRRRPLRDYLYIYHSLVRAASNAAGKSDATMKKTPLQSSFDTADQDHQHRDNRRGESPARIEGKHGLRPPVSVTRSGRQYGTRWKIGYDTLGRPKYRRTSHKEMTVEEPKEEDTSGSELHVNDTLTYQRFEKELEYAGEAALSKEGATINLYGLDVSDGEDSDMDYVSSPLAGGRVSKSRASRGDPTSSSLSRSFNVTKRILAACARYVLLLLYYLFIVPVVYLWRLIRYVALGQDDQTTSSELAHEVSGSSYKGQSGSMSHTVVTRTTTTTTTLMKDYDELGRPRQALSDQADAAGMATVSSSHDRHQGLIENTTILYRLSNFVYHLVMTCVTVVTTSVLWLPKTALGAANSVYSTAAWLVGSNAELTHSETGTVGGTRSEETSSTETFETTESINGKMAKNVRSRMAARSKTGYKGMGIRSDFTEAEDASHSYIATARPTSWLWAVVTTVVDVLRWPVDMVREFFVWRWARAVGENIYRFTATAMVTDAWLLTRTSRRRRRGGCCCWLLLLFLLPLFLTCAYYLYDRAIFSSKDGFMAFLATGESEDRGILTLASQTMYWLTWPVQAVFIGLMRERQQTKEPPPPPPPVPVPVPSSSEYSEHWQVWAKEQADSQAAALAAGLAALRQQTEATVDKQVNERVQAASIQMGDLYKTELNKITMQLVGANKQEEERAAKMELQLASIINNVENLEQRLVEEKELLMAQIADGQVKEGDSIARLNEGLAGLTTQLHELRRLYNAMETRVAGCCKNESALLLLVQRTVEEHLAAVMAAGGKPMAGASKSSTFFSWLQTQFAGRSDMDTRLQQLLTKIEAKVEADIKSSEAKATEAAEAAARAAAAAATAGTAAAASRNTENTNVNVGLAGLKEEDVVKLIKEALAIYAADRTGKVDYALESGGGSVISARCSQTYYWPTSQISLFGLPLGYTYNSPRTVIQPGALPGQCWAFSGSTGALALKLAATIHPTAVSMEHIPKSISPTGSIDSAPENFTVWGLYSENEVQGDLLGNFTYDQDGDALQTFPITKTEVGAYPAVELRIHSNHGNREYTCLYRFRVHGHLPPQP